MSCIVTGLSSVSLPRKPIYVFLCKVVVFHTYSRSINLSSVKDLYIPSPRRCIEERPTFQSMLVPKP